MGSANTLAMMAERPMLHRQQRNAALWRTLHMIALLYSNRGGSRRGAIDPDRGRRSAVGANRDKQTVQFGHEQRGTRARHRRNARDMTIRGPLGVKHVQRAAAAAHVNTVAFCIGENIVGIAT